MKKILIIGGSLQSANMGINALTKGLLNGIYGISKDVRVKLLSYTVKEKCSMQFRIDDKCFTIEEIPSSVWENIKILSRRRSGYLYSLFSEADLILDLSAGDSFTDIYGLRRYIYTSLPKLVAIVMKKKLILMPQTIGPFNNRIIKAVSRYIINNCYMNFARDITSYQYLLENMKAPKSKTALSPDLAFNMLPARDELIDEIIEPMERKRAPLVGINISALLYNGGYTSKNQFKLATDYKELTEKIIQLFIEKNCSIMLVPHVFCPYDAIEDDYTLCKHIAREIKKNYPYIYTFEKEYREEQIKAIIGKCDFFVGSRMHACIGAISMGVPAVPVAYSRKFAGIWEIYGMKDCIADARTMNINQIIEKIDHCFENRDRIREILTAEMKNVREESSSMLEFTMSC